MNPFIVVRSDALQDKELLKSPAVFMTLCAISTMTTRNKSGWCYFKQETIAKQLNKSRQAVSRDLNRLASLGYIEIVPQYYRGAQSNNEYRILFDTPLNATVQHDVAPPQHDVAPKPQHDVAPKCSYINTKEKKALTRDEFMREVDAALRAGGFAPEFEHLTESEVSNQASACWDWMEVNLKAPEQGKGAVHLRIWLRKGIRTGAIRKPEKEKVSRGEQVAEPSNPLQDWHKRIERLFEPAIFETWIRPLYWDGNGTLQAPTKFHADLVKERYEGEITKTLHNGVKIIHQPYQAEEKETCSV